ncbi:hypothetical protein EAF04_003379 [Stromatinia cepivora]|nr:hypothetical protein EAF04_003379 [Stromatinia cepivora]
MSNPWLYSSMCIGRPMTMLIAPLAPPVARTPRSYPDGRPEIQGFNDHTTHTRMALGRTRLLAMQPRARPSAHIVANGNGFVGTLRIFPEVGALDG